MFAEIPSARAAAYLIQTTALNILLVWSGPHPAYLTLVRDCCLDFIPLFIIWGLCCVVHHLSILSLCRYVSVGGKWPCAVSVCLRLCVSSTNAKDSLIKKVIKVSLGSEL